MMTMEQNRYRVSTLEQNWEKFFPVLQRFCLTGNRVSTLADRFNLITQVKEWQEWVEALLLEVLVLGFPAPYFVLDQRV